MEYRIIDADSHVNEPRELWQDRVPANLKERAPKVVELEGGRIGWSLNEGARIMPVATQAVAGLDYTQYDTTGTPFDQIRPASYDPKARLEEMEYEMIQAQVIYPGVALTGAHSYSRDREVQLACVRAYNDWLSEEFCAYAPDRLIGLPIAPVTGVEDLILEWKRVAERGARGIIISAYPNGGYDPLPEDDQFWSEVQDWDFAVHIHFGFFDTVRPSTWPKGISPTTTLLNRIGAGVYRPLADMIHMGLFERFPRLKVVAVETGIGWIPFFLETMDDNFLRHRWQSGGHLKRMPSEIFKQQIWATFVTDVHGLENRHKYNVDRIMWSTDYPHVQTDWPNSQRIISYEFRGIPEDEKQKILRGNAMKLYKLGDNGSAA